MKSLAGFLRRINKFRHFDTIHDVSLFFQILLLWIALPCLLLLPLRKMLRLFTPRQRIVAEETVIRRRYQKILHYACYWFRWKWIDRHNSCLKKSLLLYYFLNREGIPTRICFGIKKNEENLCGHSWIETPYSYFFPPDDHEDFIRIYTYSETPVEIFIIS